MCTLKNEHVPSKWKNQGVHVPPNRNMSGHAGMVFIIFIQINIKQSVSKQ